MISSCVISVSLTLTAKSMIDPYRTRATGIMRFGVGERVLGCSRSYQYVTVSAWGYGECLGEYGEGTYVRARHVTVSRCGCQVVGLLQGFKK